MCQHNSPLVLVTTHASAEEDACQWRGKMKTSIHRQIDACVRLGGGVVAPASLAPLAELS